MSANFSNSDLGLYVHWPFCLNKCPYCDFNSHVSSAHDDDAFGTALCHEMAHMATLLPNKRVLTSIFFGGGTPSLMPPTVVAKIINHAEKIFGFAPTIEISAEANPTSVEARMMTEFFHAGVNRVSMGVQSFDDDILEFLGRTHNVSEAFAALRTVRRNFNNFSIDLIYATAGQTLKSWQAELTQALDLDLPHLSLYQLTIEPGTVFHTRHRTGEKLNLDDDLAADLFELTQSLTASAGLPAYEISNHAKLGMACQHNLNYWKAGDWVGIGPGAHGRFYMRSNDNAELCRINTATRRSPMGWLESVQTRNHGIAKQTTEKAAECAAEMLMMGLRLVDGIRVDQIETLCGPQDGWLDRAALAQAFEAGWLNMKTDDLSGKNTRIYATATGRLRLNNILAMILC